MYMLSPRQDHVELMNLRSGDVYIADKIGERGEPWGVPWLRWMGSDLRPLKDRRMLR